MNHAMKLSTALLVGVLGMRMCASSSSVRGLGDHGASTDGDPSLVLSIQRSGKRDDENNLVAALWSDGLLCFSSGKKALFYKAEPDKVAVFRKHLDDGAGIDALRASFLVPDHESLTMRFVSKATTCVACWDEIIAPNWGANISASDEYRAFVTAWYDTRVRLVSVASSIENSLSEEERARRIEQAENWRP